MKKVVSLRNLLLSFAIALIAICAAGAVEARAALSYDPTNDLLKSSDGKDYVCVISKAGAKIKKDETLIQVTTAGISVSAADGLGVKSTKKDVLLAVFTTPSLDKDIESATVGFTIKGQLAKKVVGSIDYTQADDPSSETVLGATWTDANKKTQVLAQNSIGWSETQEGPYAKADTLTGAKLAGWLEAGKTIYIKMAGDAGDGKSAIRTSAPVKVKIAKQKKASKVKVDVKKSTISIKNGFDFGINTSTTEGTVVVEKWHTVLPYLKDAKEADAIFETEKFAPMDKKLDNAKKTLLEREQIDGKVSYTKNKLKALSLADLYGELGLDDMSGDIKLAVRKSATFKAPASAVFTCTVKGQTSSPYVATQLKYKNDYVIKQAAGSEVKFTVPDLYLGGEYTGFGDKLAPKTGDTTADPNPAKYEYLVVSIKDLDTIDWSKTGWKSLKKGTKITLGKTKVNYYAFNATGATAKKSVTLNAKTVTEAWDPAGLNVAELDQKLDTVMLVRRAGAKGKTVDTTVQASAYTITYFIKETVGGKSTMTWYTTAPIGEEALKYTIKTAVLTNKAEDPYAVDDTKTIAGLVATGGSEKVELAIDSELILLSGETTADDGTYTPATESAKATFTPKKDGAVLTLQYAKKAEVTVKLKTSADGGATWTDGPDIGVLTKAMPLYHAQGVTLDDLKGSYTPAEGYTFDQTTTVEKNAILTEKVEGETKNLILTADKDKTTVTLYFKKAAAVEPKSVTVTVKAQKDGNTPLTGYGDSTISNVFKVNVEADYTVKAFDSYIFDLQATKEANKGGNTVINETTSTEQSLKVTFKAEQAELVLVFKDDPNNSGGAGA